MSKRHLLLGLAAGMALGAGLTRVLESSDERDIAASGNGSDTSLRSIGAAHTGGAKAVAATPAEAASSTASDRSHNIPASVAQTAAPPRNTLEPAFLHVSDQALLAGLSAEHAEMLAPPPKERVPQTMPEMHAQFALEGKDNAWSYEMEAALRQFVSERTDPQDIDLVRAECKATVCEVLAFGNLPDSQDRWTRIGEQMRDQPWWREFTGMWSNSSDAGGRAVFAFILQRRQG